MLLSVDPSTWQDEAALIGEHLAGFGRQLPEQLHEEHDALLKRLSAASLPEIEAPALRQMAALRRG